MKSNKHSHYFGSRTLYIRLLIIIGVIVLLSLTAHWFDLYIPQIENWINSLGVWAPIAFILLFMITTPFFLSVDALCVTAGVLFPLITGGVYIVISTYLAASVIFILGRYFFRNKVNILLEKQPKLQYLNTLTDKDNFKIMFLLRLLPLPFALLSYAFSVTQVTFKTYISSSSGILIYNLTLVYFGYAAKHLTTIGRAQTNHTINFPLLVFGMIVVLLILALIVHTARKAIAQIDPAMAEINHNN